MQTLPEFVYFDASSRRVYVASSDVTMVGTWSGAVPYLADVSVVDWGTDGSQYVAIWDNLNQPPGTRWWSPFVMIVEALPDALPAPTQPTPIFVGSGPPGPAGPPGASGTVYVVGTGFYGTAYSGTAQTAYPFLCSDGLLRDVILQEQDGYFSVAVDQTGYSGSNYQGPLWLQGPPGPAGPAGASGTVFVGSSGTAQAAYPFLCSDGLLRDVTVQEQDGYFSVAVDQTGYSGSH